MVRIQKLVHNILIFKLSAGMSLLNVTTLQQPPSYQSENTSDLLLPPSLEAWIEPILKVIICVDTHYEIIGMIFVLIFPLQPKQTRAQLSDVSNEIVLYSS